MERFSLATGVPCAPLQSVDYGSIENVCEVYECDANYSCQPGYMLEGINRIACMASGNWSAPAPTCLGECILMLIYSALKREEPLIYITCHCKSVETDHNLFFYVTKLLIIYYFHL